MSVSPSTDHKRRERAAVHRSQPSPHQGARLTFEAIHRSFGAVAAVNGVSLDLQAGEILSLLGASGCGKTTLLRIAAGLERQDSGRLLIDGQEVAGPDRYLAPEERGVGMMFQDYALFPHLTVLDNVAFGVRGSDARQHAEEALDRVGLLSLSGAFPHTLSGGEQQRAALARALAPRPRVLLMDEPFSGLDRGLRDAVRTDTLSVLKGADMSAIMVTHDPEEALLMADTIALMRTGKIAQIGSPDDLYFRPIDAGTARFFSNVNAFDGIVSSGVVHTPLGAFEAEAFDEGAAVEVFVRESGISINASSGGISAEVSYVRFGGEMTHVVARILPDGPEIRLRMAGPVRLEPTDVIGLDADPVMTHIFAK